MPVARAPAAAELLTMTPDDWGWTSYRRSGWVRDDPDGTRRLYKATFRTSSIPPTLDYEEVSVQFWARRPILALRHIAASGKHPSDFHSGQVN